MASATPPFRQLGAEVNRSQLPTRLVQAVWFSCRVDDRSVLLVQVWASLDIRYCVYTPWKMQVEMLITWKHATRTACDGQYTPSVLAVAFDIWSVQLSSPASSRGSGGTGMLANKSLYCD